MNKKIDIIPAVIPASIDEVKQHIDKVASLVEWVQIDIMDGMFVESLTWPYSKGDVAEINELTGKTPKIECHFMVQEPEAVLDKWISSGISRAIIHIESTNKLNDILAKFMYAGVKAGIAIDLETPISVLEPYAEQVHLVQLMSISRLGHHGEHFDEKVLPKIRTLCERYPHLTIQVDGGINYETAKKVLEAGATNLVVGAYILNSDNIKQTINGLSALGE